MQKMLLLIAALAFILLPGCGNIFDGNIADDSSAAAKAEELEIALNNKDYNAIIRTLERADGNYSSLKTREKYLLQMAWMGQAGFSSLNVLDKLLEDNNNKNMGEILFSACSKPGEKNLMKDEQNDYIKAKLNLYIKARDMKNYAGGVEEITAISGVAAGLHTLMAVALVGQMLNTGGKVIDFDPDSPNFIGKQFENKSVAELESKITSMIDPEVINELADNAELLAETVAFFGGGTDMAADFSQFKEELVDGSGKITIRSLSEFIARNWGQT